MAKVTCESVFSSWHQFLRDDLNNRLLTGGPWRRIALLVTTVLAACGGGSPSDEPEAASPLRLEAASSVTQTVGPAGGTLTTTSANGTVYTLSVPARALRTAASITLAPIAEIDDLPAGVSLAGGAHLTPEGQTFDVPVTLTVALPTPPPNAPVPFTYAGQLSERRLYPAVLNDRMLTFEIVHFSGYAALLALPDIDLVLGNGYFPPTSAATDQALQALVGAASGPPGEARRAAMLAVLRGWLDNVIKPAVVAIQAIGAIDVNPGSANGAALEATTRLSYAMKAFDIATKYTFLTAGGTEEIYLDFQVAVRDTARHVMPLFNQACDSFPAALHLAVPEILAWQELARYSSTTTLDPTLERQAVLDALCVQVAYDPNGGVDFPTGIQPGQTGTLGVRAGYSVNGGPVRFDLPLFVLLTGASNVSPAGLQARLAPAAGANAQQTFLWNAATDEMRIEVEACLADEQLREVCGQAFVVRGIAPDAAGCQEYTATLGELRSVTSRVHAEIILGNARASASHRNGGVHSFDRTTTTARSVDYFRIDAPGATGDVQAQLRHQVVLANAVPALPAPSASVTLTWSGGSRTFTEFADYGVVHVPLAVRHGDVIRLEGFASVAPGPGAGAGATYSMRIDPIPGVLDVISLACPP
jgi:hypothetical protein